MADQVEQVAVLARCGIRPLPRLAGAGEAGEAALGTGCGTLRTADCAVVLDGLMDGGPGRYPTRPTGCRSECRGNGRIGTCRGNPLAVAKPGIGAPELPPAALPDTRPTGALLLFYNEGTARRISARRSQTARGVIIPRLNTGMPQTSAMQMAIPVLPSMRPSADQLCCRQHYSSRRPHRPADPASVRAPPRSWHAASGRPANTAPTPDATARRSPCTPTSRRRPCCRNRPARGKRNPQVSPMLGKRKGAQLAYFLNSYQGRCRRTRRELLREF